VAEGTNANEGREQWGTRAGFILAAVGSVIGISMRRCPRTLAGLALVPTGA
jgi:SNF family Na+-dependent transporter